MLYPSNNTPNPVHKSYAMWQAQEEQDRQTEVLLSRYYYQGAKVTKLSSDMAAVLGQLEKRAGWKFNVIRPIVTSVAERLTFASFVTDSETHDAYIQRVVDTQDMDEKQDTVYRDAINDGEAFLVLEWDKERNVPKLVPHPRYVASNAKPDGAVIDLSEQNLGDEFGCRAFYANDDANQELLYVSKRWREDLGGGRARMRKNDYYPDRIERYYADVLAGEMAWREYSDDDGGAVLPWVDASGRPLGIAAIHFTNPDMRPEAIDAWSTQDQLLNSIIDFAANNRIAAFRIYSAFGFMPTTDGKPPAADGSNRVRIVPGMVIGAAQSNGTHPASFNAIEGADSAPFIATLEANIRYASMLTDTPVERFQMTRQVASEGTQAAYNETLINKVEKRQTRFANAWSRVWMLALRMAEAWGGLAALPDGTAITTNWKPAYKRKLDEIVKESDAKSRAGIPQETIWAEVWGYTPDQIAAMQQQPSYLERQAINRAGLDVDANG
jgi:hypothetical protein